MRTLLSIVLVLPLMVLAQYDPAGGEVGSYSVNRDDPAIYDWADSVIVYRGYMDTAETRLGRADAGENNNALGPADNSVVSLGDGGIATLFFESAIRNYNGADFAVFENGFFAGGGYFLELAFIEVSTDGQVYTRFPAKTAADTTVQFDNFGRSEPEWYKNLAGKHQAPYGTLFDLDEIDMDSVHYVRVIDVIGAIDSSIGSRDSDGKIINDPYPTGFGSSGFDLDAVAAVRGQFIAIPEVVAGQKVYPSLLKQQDILHINLAEGEHWIIRDMAGRQIMAGANDKVQLNAKGQFILELYHGANQSNIKICVY